MGLFIWLQRNLYSQSSWGDPPAPASPPPLPLSAGVRRYWRHFVPMALFPSFAVALVQAPAAWSMPLLVVLFFASSFYALWPVLRGRVAYSFWILATGVYLFGGGLMALLLSPAIAAVFGAPGR